MGPAAVRSDAGRDPAYGGRVVSVGSLVCEPFLIVGLIACIRRILVITLETSRITQPSRWSGADIGLFHASMLELGILGALIVVLVGSIYVNRLSHTHADPSKTSV